MSSRGPLALIAITTLARVAFLRGLFRVEALGHVLERLPGASVGSSPSLACGEAFPTASSDSIDRSRDQELDISSPSRNKWAARGAENLERRVPSDLHVKRP